MLSDDQDLKVCVKSAAWGGVTAGGGAMAGAMMAGPPGMLVGESEKLFHVPKMWIFHCKRSICDFFRTQEGIPGQRNEV